MSEAFYKRVPNESNVLSFFAISGRILNNPRFITAMWNRYIEKMKLVYESAIWNQLEMAKCMRELSSAQHIMWVSYFWDEEHRKAVHAKLGEWEWFEAYEIYSQFGQSRWIRLSTEVEKASLFIEEQAIKAKMDVIAENIKKGVHIIQWPWWDNPALQK